MPFHISESNIKNIPSYRCLDFWFALGISISPFFLKAFVTLTSNNMPTKVLPSIISSINDTPQLLTAMFVFALTILIVHCLIGFLAWRLWRPFSQTFNCSTALGILFFTVLQGSIFSLNSLLFPNSVMQVEMPLFIICFGGVGLAVVLIWHSQRYLTLIKLSKWHPGYIILLLSSLLLAGFLVNSKADLKTYQQRDKPDIIIIGLDSFRPDHLKQSGDTVSITPHLDEFLTEAYRFERTYTPMARTYPAWMSILTGRYPIEHGARFNLLNPKYLNDPERSLPFLLKAQGYTTAYSIDETRFSNIDKRYGFDITVTPAIGAADFLLSVAADMPLINLLNLTPTLHAALFPYQFINRAVHNTYEPANFDKELAHLVSTADPKHPLFLVTHFELPHWPFDWRDSAHYVAPENPRLTTLSPVYYQKAVHRADRQFSDLIGLLKSNGRLDNAIVVVLSDHGEGFFEFSPVWNSSDNQRLVLPPFALHGVNVLDESQTRVLLAFKTYGKNRLALQGMSYKLASLVDVAPTVMSLAKIDKQSLNASGCDLFATQNNRKDCQQERVVFTESGFYVPSLVENNTLDQNKVAQEAYAYYDVNLDTRLTLKDEFLQRLFDNKQRAVISDQGVFAYLPINGNKQFLLGNLTQRTYRKVNKSKENQLIRKLCQRYAGDDVALDNFCQLDKSD